MVLKISRLLKQVFLLFPLLLLLCISCAGDRAKKDQPVVKDGILDLRDWDFHRDGPVDLKGDWKFKWMEDREEFSSIACDDSKWDVLSVPGSWHHKTGTPYGYGWLRLKIRLNPEMKKDTLPHLALYLNFFLSAYTMYINNAVFMNSGVVYSSNNEERPQMLKQVQPLSVSSQNNNSEEIVIAAKISNYNYILGGPHKTPRLGLYKQLVSYAWNKDMADFIFLGIMLMMILYHLALWIGRPADKASLYFVFFCFAALLRVVYDTHLVTKSFPHPEMFDIQMKLCFLPITLLYVFASTFYSELFPDEFSKRIVRFFQVLGVLCSLIIIITPVRIFSQFLVVYEIIMSLLILWIIVALIIAAKRKKMGASLILLAVAVTFIAVLNDILVSLTIIHNQIYGHLGFLFVIFAQSTALSTRFSHAFRTAEHLSENLMKEVDIKTHDLQHRTAEAENAKKEVEKSNQKLKEMDHFKNVFFQNVTHELRTPLTIIIGYIENVLAEPLPSPEDFHKKHIIILSNARRLLRLINQLLDLSKFDGNEMKLDSKPVDIIEILRNIIASFESITYNKKIEYAAVFETENFIANFDREKIEKIFYNLLSNAVKFTNENGKVAVSVNKNDKEIIVSVCDTGIGIPREKMEHVFDRFYQVDGSSTREQEGTGIGLSLVKEYVDLHNGEIRVESEEGQGTLFTVLLPITITENNRTIEYDTALEYQTAAERRAVYMSDVDDIAGEKAGENEIDKWENRETGDARKKILIVEDNKDMRGFIREILHGMYEIYEAENGVEGVEHAREYIPDLIISDIMMPKMDGNQLLQALKNDEKTCRIPVIILTAKASDDVRLDGLEAGADEYLSKPFNTRELMTRITSLIKIYDYQRIISDRNKEVERDLERARLLQANLLPEQVFNNSMVNYSAEYRPMDKIGGDFYDCFEDENSLGFFIADVSGHGITGAFLAILTKILLESNITRLDSVSETLLKLNKEILKYTVECNFVTAFLCLIEKDTRTLRYCSAGHEPVFVYRPGESALLVLKTKGALLGVFKDLVVEEKEIVLEHGDRIILYTDGVVECENRSREVFGLDRFTTFITEHAEFSPEDFTAKLIQDLIEFAGSNSLSDDVTLLVVDVA
ncbi:MAG: SpoIIE family protein phosphatase [bacterium]|nr:SpoIIE family protein phosphatase [bacterium]